MLKSAQQLVRDSAKKLNLTDKQIQDLLKFEHEHNFEIEIAGGKKYQAYRVQHSNKRGPYKGGIRFHPNVSLDEVRALATIMSLKTAAVGLPLGGAKGAVAVDTSDLSDKELEELSRKYAALLAPHIGPTKDVPAPDVRTDSRVIDWMVDEYQKQTGESSGASFTGKSIEQGGSLGRQSATGHGGVIALQELLQKLGNAEQRLTFAIQGFGNVGTYFGTIAETMQPNWKLVAVTDSKGGIYNKSGLSAKALAKFKAAGKNLKGSDAGDAITNDELIGLDVDVLVLAALEDTVDNKNMSQVRAKFIVEMANGPVSQPADQYLTNKGVVIVPDIIANAGGVIVSYLEMQQNLSNQKWSEAEVNAQLQKYIIKAVGDAYNYSQKTKSSLKEAALIIAVKRLAN